jgi:FMN phosphatase YigB (HAD superfamily)
VTAPHLVLEINAACNIQCAGCYKTMTGEHKPVARIMAELDLAERERRVQTVSLAGGETTLHPELAELVRRIHGRGYKTAVLTNGLGLDDPTLSGLARAGLDLVQLHIDEGQRRPDLPAPPAMKAIHALRERIADRVARHGMDAGLCVTLYPDPVESVTALVDHVLQSPWLHFLFASHYFDPVAFAAAFARRDSSWRPATSNTAVRGELRQTRGLEPFACLRGPAVDEGADAPGWLTYLAPVLRTHGRAHPLRVRSTRADMWPFHLARLLSGRYVFYCKPHSAALTVQVLLNGLCTGRLGQAVRFLAGGMRRHATVGCKRMVFDNGPRIMPDGRTECAGLCPNATVRNGKLCGICTADMVETRHEE